MARYVVAAVDEIPPGGRKIVEVAGRSIGVFNVGGEFFALRNRCPHQGGPLCLGGLGGFVTAVAPGEYRYSRAGESLRCPWHGWEFDVRTGQSWFDPKRVRVRRYEVDIEPGAALAPRVSATAPGTPAAGNNFPAQAAPPATAEALPPDRLPGPYVAETYPVVVERAYVVVEIPSGAGGSAEGRGETATEG